MKWVELPYYESTVSKKEHCLAVKTLESKIKQMQIEGGGAKLIPFEVRELVEQLSEVAQNGNVNLGLVAAYSGKLRAVRSLIEAEDRANG